MTYHFNWSVLWSGQTGAWLLHGVVMTAGDFVGRLVHRRRTRGFFPARFAPCRYCPLRWLAAGYVEFFSAMCHCSFGCFLVLRRAAVRYRRRCRTGCSITAAEFWAGAFALGVYHGARFSEVIPLGDRRDSEDSVRSSGIHRFDNGASLPPGHPSYCFPLDRAAGDQRDVKSFKELFRGADHRRRRVDFSSPPDRNL